MNTGRTVPQFEILALIYAGSHELQSSVSEYFIIVIHLYHEILKSMKKSSFGKLGYSFSDSNLDSWGNIVKDNMHYLMAKWIKEESKASSHFRDMSAKFYIPISDQ